MPRAALLFFLIAATRLLTGQNSETFPLTGNALNAATGQPVRRAEILLRGQTAETSNLTGQADAAGHFVFPALPAGNYFIAAAKNGFSPAPGRVIVLGPATPDVTLRLAPLGRITGKVLDENGDPMQNANIQVFRSQLQMGRRSIVSSSSAISNDLGEFHVSSLVAGRYYVSATASPEPGAAYPRTFYGNTQDLAASVPVELEPGGSASTEISLRPALAFRVSGSIANLPKGLHPYLNIVRQGAALSASENHATMLNPATGDFAFNGITPGNWVVTAGCFERNAQMFGFVEIAVSSADVEGLAVTLAPPFLLSGRVHTLENNGTVPNLKSVYISVRPVGDGAQPPQGGPRIEDDGNFALSISQPGEYALSVRVPDPWFAKQILMGGVNMAFSTFRVTAGGAPGPVDILLSSQGAEVEGAVVENNAPAASAAILLMGPAGEKFAAAGLDGHFHIGALPAGDYTAYAFPSLDNVEYTNPEAMRPFSSAHFSLAEGAKQQVELTLNRTVY